MSFHAKPLPKGNYFFYVAKGFVLNIINIGTFLFWVGLVVFGADFWFFVYVLLIYLLFDIVFYFFATKGRIAHTGIVVEADSNYDFKTVEGNTSSGLKDVVDRDGQGVYMKQRSISSLGLFGGVVRLPY